MHTMCIFRILLMVTFSLWRSPSGSFESDDSTGRGGLHGWRFPDVRGTTPRWKRWRGCYNFRLTCRQNIWDTDCIWEHDRSRIFAHMHIWSCYVCHGHHRGAHFRKWFGSVNTLYTLHFGWIQNFYGRRALYLTWHRGLWLQVANHKEYLPKADGLYFSQPF